MKFVVIGGHLDSWDLGTGAVDDGAGVSITMAAGALIGQMKQAPRRTFALLRSPTKNRVYTAPKPMPNPTKTNVANHQIGAESDFGAGTPRVK